jgi:hypothetical protein
MGLMLATGENLDNAFTWSSLGTIGGSVFLVWLFANAAGALFWGPNQAHYRAWGGFLLALLIQYGLAAAASGDWRRWIVAFANALLVFTSAYGLNEGSAPSPTPFPAPPAPAPAPPAGGGAPARAPAPARGLASLRSPFRMSWRT